MYSSRITVLFFGQLQEQTGTPSLSLQDLKDTDEALTHIKSKYPVLQQSHFQIALDKEIIHNNIILTGEHTLALLPPYAGG